MKAITIKLILSAVLRQATLLLPKNLRAGFIKHAYIAGGCIYSLYNGKTPHDYDIFLDDKKCANKVREYFLTFTDPESHSEFRHGTYKGRKLLVSENAITYGKLQIITKYIGTPEDVVSQFDFKHNMFSFRNGELKSHSGCWCCLKSKKLIFNAARARDIAGTVLRIPKFVNRGMVISKNEMGKILKALYKTDFREHDLDALLKDNY
jgi:hypothetical protein